MNFSPSISLVFPPVSALLGIASSVWIFNKLSHVIEYTLNKNFGDYTALQKTLDDRVIVSMGELNDYYVAQNIVLAALIATVSSIGVLILISHGLPGDIAFPLITSYIISPAICALHNIIIRRTGGHRGRWVQLSEEELKKREIDKKTIEEQRWSSRVYHTFGSGPKWFRGAHTDDDHC
jgi:hypothetical protein